MARNRHKSAGTLRYDIVRSEMHQKDKFAQSLHPKTEWLWVHDRENCALDALHFGDFEIPEVKLTQVAPEPWEHSGYLASFSAGSEVAVVLEFLRKSSSTDSKPESDSFNVSSMEIPPSFESPVSHLVAMNHAAFVISLARLRDEYQGHHRWVSGPNGRMTWRHQPIRRSSPDLQRYTVSCHPSLVRAMVSLLRTSAGEAAVLKAMKKAAESVVAAFQRVTGRKVVGLSIDIYGCPCWNVWHSGLERVIYEVPTKGIARIRFRKTPFRLNKTGHLLVAWDRIRRSFERMGSDIAETCPLIVRELARAEANCRMRQGRGPGDWAIHQIADTTLERILVDDGWHDLVEAGYTEFIANEKMRYAESK